jgi:hypothetical protein
MFKVLESDSIPEIAIQAVGLLHQHDAAAGVRTQKLHHLLKTFPSGSFCSFYVDKLTADEKAVLDGIFAKHLEIAIVASPIPLE